ncbi:hypothetical protein KL930_004683 [Ogataea haglerorum]|uniref:Dolichyl-diphosphooligosaccharide--protein glycosyltransferase subunit 1 n=1 Tax=Ogataea haglerorum TaxID=1937702 RepID=A0ABQ7RKU7_9ASCO|nr:hypothetical protein KL951_001048 [Ogataea haglerorum]KAG7710373.1 hypothetical protein KL914_001283 [Ogataea haglerorum]KAG7714596.1 hypothetical protein KL913_004366 [Ogataea haglerorum]KAG7715366.1 hypothetical protein KL949_004280 [Ogataea haglerorum]KAG7737245.1 hypothetical protein KL932_004205 [Ogataea haglerorum]
MGNMYRLEDLHKDSNQSAISTLAPTLLRSRASSSMYTQDPDMLSDDELVSIDSDRRVDLRSNVWENVKYDRLIDVLKSYVKERHVIHARNIAGEPTSEYYFAVPGFVRDDVALFIVTLEAPRQQDPLLQAERVPELSSPDVVYYKIQLPYPIAPKSQIHLTVSYVLTDQLHPAPEKGPMGAEQRLFFKTTKLALSAYDTLSYELKILGAKMPQEMTLDLPADVDPEEFKASSRDPFLVYGPYQKKFKPLSNLPLALIFTKNQPLPFVNLLKRDFWVSHWSDSLQLEEYYELTNKGLQLDKGFSRVDWMNGRYTMRPTSVITSIQIPLPKVETSEVYFVDKVGNVSTSLFHNNELVLKPRFPIFGGWNYNFTVGWTSPLSKFLKSEGDLHVLRVPLLDGLNDATYDRVEISFFLPEGAKFVGFDDILNLKEWKIDHKFSYLDITTGHTQVTFVLENLVDEMRNVDILIEYEYGLAGMLRKPVTAAVYIFGALLGLFLLRKIDLSIRPSA